MGLAHCVDLNAELWECESRQDTRSAAPCWCPRVGQRGLLGSVAGHVTKSARGFVGSPWTF